MDTQRDFAPFRELLDQLCASLRQGDFRASDAMVKAYWDALREEPFGEVKANVKRIIATATADTPFPRPNSLRNKTLSITVGVPNSTRERIARESLRHWESLRERDPVEFAILARCARLARELAGMSQEDPRWRDVDREQYRWNRLRYAPRAEQEVAVRAYLGRNP